MKKFISLFVLALIALPVSVSAAGTSGSMGGVNTAWFQCQANTDCVAVQTACNKWEGVNKRHARDFAATVPKFNMQAAAGCPAPPQMNAMKLAALPRCIANFCTVLLPKMSP